MEDVTIVTTPFISTYILPVILGAILFQMGLVLTSRDLKSIFVYPKAVILGLILQLFTLPLIAFFLAKNSDLSPELQVGLVLVASCPGGATSNLLIYYLKGNVALSVSLTTINSFITFFTIPAILKLTVNYFLESTKTVSLPFIDMLIQIFFITLIPFLLGILIRAKYQKIAFQLIDKLKPLTPILLTLAMAAAIFFEKKEKSQVTLEDYGTCFPYVIIMNSLGLIIGFLLPLIFSLGKRSRLTIAVEVGLQNTGLALTIASSTYLMNSPMMAVPAALYAVFSIPIVIIFGLIVNRRIIFFSLKNIRRK